MPRSKATSTPDRRRRPAVPTFRFVGGKGGVGKTTCAAALGLAAARRGRRTLLVSTDPAPSLADALRQRLGAMPRPVKGRKNLFAVEIDAPAALSRWIGARRHLLEEIALRGTWLDREDVERLLRLSLPGIDEVAALLQLGDFSESGDYDHIVVDTAPTGHMLRMLSMPAVLGGLAQVFDRMQGKHRILVDAIRGGWTPDAADVLIGSIDQQATRIDDIMRDHERSQLAWVTLPEAMAIAETADGLAALAAQRVLVDRVIVNRVTAAPPQPCPWCTTRRRIEHEAMARLEDVIGAGLTVAAVAAEAAEPRGFTAIARIGRQIEEQARVRRTGRAAGKPARAVAASSTPAQGPAPRLAGPATRLLIFGGKGGVGKTTCAASAALRLALESSARTVLLLSADPAHSLGDVFDEALSDRQRTVAGGPPNLLVRELDAHRGFAALRERFAAAIEELFAKMSGTGAGGATISHERQVLSDLLDLAPPGVDELIAVIEVTDALLSNRQDHAIDLVVVDSAPTGHALRLLEMPALVHEWVKAVMSILLKYQSIVGVGELGSVLLRLSQGLGRLRELLSDSRRTTFVAVTRPAALPRAETIRLLRRLKAASIAAPVVLVNAYGAGSCTRCLRERRVQQRELGTLRREAGRSRRAPSVILAPGWAPAPSGAEDLRLFAGQWRTAGAARQG